MLHSEHTVFQITAASTYKINAAFRHCTKHKTQYEPGLQLAPSSEPQGLLGLCQNNSLHLWIRNAYENKKKDNFYAKQCVLMKKQLIFAEESKKHSLWLSTNNEHNNDFNKLFFFPPQMSNISSEMLRAPTEHFERKIQTQKTHYFTLTHGCRISLPEKAGER